MNVLSDIFEYMEEEQAAAYIEEMDIKKAAAILSGMETDVLADVLQKLDKTRKKILMDLLEPKVRRDVELIASFDEDEIGSRMTTNYIVITKGLTVKQAMNSLVAQAAKNDNISTIFVVTDQQKFYGAIGLYIYLIKGKTLLFAYAVSACIGVALLFAMLISSAVGTCIPLFFKKIHVDPAVASGPLITTINDLVAVVSYYGLGWLFLLKILHLAG